MASVRRGSENTSSFGWTLSDSAGAVANNRYVNITDTQIERGNVKKIGLDLMMLSRIGNQSRLVRITVRTLWKDGLTLIS